uniref:Uncharacterized protein n=1 Tax=Myoviridae sp. ctCo31 TaxID=2825053 RepID=A0A8S5UMA8_9CAUD|nr:MAG TPA: hypothetical protein [Myoviridae sp. ctCo31]
MQIIYSKSSLRVSLRSIQMLLLQFLMPMLTVLALLKF